MNLIFGSVYFCSIHTYKGASISEAIEVMFADNKQIQRNLNKV